MNMVPFLKHHFNGSEGLFQTGVTHTQELPKTINMSYCSTQPLSGEKAVFYPYRKELVVNGQPVPTLTDILKHSYFPPMKSEDEIVQYRAQRSGRSEAEVAYDMFRMRRVRLACAQSMRDKLKAKWVRQPEGHWDPVERKYIDQTYIAARDFSSDGFHNHNFDPLVYYSPTYMFGEMLDLLIWRQERTTQEYQLVDVFTDQCLPRSRFPDVRGKCKPPLEHIEPCLYELHRVKMSILCCLLAPDQHVTDNPWDTGHTYYAAFAQFYRGADPNEVHHVCQGYKVDLDLGWTWLRYHYDNVVKPLRIEKC